VIDQSLALADHS